MTVHVNDKLILYDNLNPPPVLQVPPNEPASGTESKHILEVPEPTETVSEFPMNSIYQQLYPNWLFFIDIHMHESIISMHESLFIQ